MKKYPNQDVAKRVAEKYPYLATSVKSTGSSVYVYDEQELSGFAVAYAIEAAKNIENMPIGVSVYDADTILKDILGGTDIEICAGVEVLERWLEASCELEQKGAEAMFELLTFVPFSEFVQRCIEETRIEPEKEYRKVEVCCINKQDPASSYFGVLMVNEGVDPLEAVHAAVNEYVCTQEGYDVYSEPEDHGPTDAFTWYDFWDTIPEWYCWGHGIIKLGEGTSEEQIEVDAYDNLAVNPHFDVTDIEWDTDGVEGDDKYIALPEEVDVPFAELLNPGEMPYEVSYDEMLDRLTEYLTKEYEFCVKGYNLNKAVQRDVE